MLERYGGGTPGASNFPSNIPHIISENPCEYWPYEIPGLASFGAPRLARIVCNSAASTFYPGHKTVSIILSVIIGLKLVMTH